MEQEREELWKTRITIEQHNSNISDLHGQLQARDATIEELQKKIDYLTDQYMADYLGG